jgi:hypothetical protein
LTQRSTKRNEQVRYAGHHPHPAGLLQKGAALTSALPAQERPYLRPRKKTELEFQPAKDPLLSRTTPLERLACKDHKRFVIKRIDYNGFSPDQTSSLNEKRSANAKPDHHEHEVYPK